MRLRTKLKYGITSNLRLGALFFARKSAEGRGREKRMPDICPLPHPLLSPSSS